MSKIFVIWKYDIKVFPSLHNSYFESGMLWIRDDGLWKCNLSMSPPPFYMKIKHSIWSRENIKLRHSEWKCFDMKTWMKIQVISNHLTTNLFKLNWRKKNWSANQSHITEISFMPISLKSLILMGPSLSLITEDRFEGSLTPFLYFRPRARVNPQLSWESRCWSRPSHQFRTIIIIIIIIMFLIVSRSWSSLLFFKPAFLIAKSQILKTNVCHLPQPLNITSIMVQLKRFLPSRKTITLSTTSSLLIELLNRVPYDDVDGKSFIG